MDNKKRREQLNIAYKKNPTPFILRSQKYRDELKYQTLSHYSKTKEPSCGMCGFKDIRALCLDHIENNGNSDRVKIMGKNYAGSGSRFYVKVRRLGYPKGYQTLCSNCNLIKEIENRKNVK
jgi:hypothetical protein